MTSQRGIEEQASLNRARCAVARQFLGFVDAPVERRRVVVSRPLSANIDVRDLCNVRECRRDRLLEDDPFAFEFCHDLFLFLFTGCEFRDLAFCCSFHRRHGSA